jgi:hypothetical protein
MRPEKGRKNPDFSILSKKTRTQSSFKLNEVLHVLTIRALSH